MERASFLPADGLEPGHAAMRCSAIFLTTANPNPAPHVAAVGIAKTGFKTLVRLELAEFFLFQAILASQYLPYRGCQILIDQDRKTPAKNAKPERAHRRTPETLISRNKHEYRNLVEDTYFGSNANCSS